MSGFKKNTAVTGFPFALVSATDGSAVTSGTTTVYYTLDGGTQTSLGTATHEGNGQWTINLTAASMNGDIVGLTCVNAAAVTVHFTIKTDTKILSDLNDIAATAIVSSGAITTSAGAVSTVTSVTNAITLPTIPANWITAAGIAAAAMNGKGDWNIGKTGYTLTQAFPTNFADLAITASTGLVTVGTNNDKTGYSISGAITTLDGLNNLSAADVNTQVDTALSDIRLDELFNVALGSQPTAGSLFGDLTEDDAGTQRFTVNALENAPGGGGGGDATAANQTTIITHLTDIKGATWATTDSLEAIRNQGDSAWTTSTLAATDIVSAGAITTSGGAVSTVSTVSNAVTLPTIPANWISAAGIAASALNGKGDWNIGKTGYSLTQAFPANFADLAITASTGLITVGTNNDKTGYSISGTKTTLDALVDISAAQVNAEVLDVFNTDTFAEPAQGAPAATTTLATKIGYIYKFLRNKKDANSTTINIYDDAGTTVDHKRSISDDGTTYTEEEVVSGP